MLTFIRIFVTIYVDPQNPTKVEAFTVLITGLEPILGVTNACLPFMPLVFKWIRDTDVFQSASTSLGSITRRRLKRDSTLTTEVLEAGYSGPYKGLPDIEMGPRKDTSFFRSLVASERGDEVPRNQPWDGSESQDHIFVQKDFSIKSERH